MIDNRYHILIIERTEDNLSQDMRQINGVYTQKFKQSPTNSAQIVLAKPLKRYEANAFDRKRTMALAYASGDYSMKEISAWFSVHYSHY